MREDITVREFVKRRKAALKPVAMSALDAKFAWMRARQAEQDAIEILRQQGRRKVSLASGGRFE
jgi:hypothetical protein